MKSPFSIIIAQHDPIGSCGPFVAALRKTFLGIESGQSYTMSGYELVDPLDFRIYSGDKALPDRKKERVAEACEALLVVLLLGADEGLVPKVQDLITQWEDFVANEPHAYLLVVSLAKDAAPGLSAKVPDGRVMALGLKALNERDLRRDLLSLHALNGALTLLGAVRSDSPSLGSLQRPTLFISHAKRDGVPLAMSITHWIQALQFSFFYDTVNLDLKGDISAQLEQAVSGSILIVLRTEIFDQRYWCQKEIYWAEKHGVPILAVDGRWGLQQSPSVIMFDSSPAVRIPDGSMVRILLAAMSEAFRVVLFRARTRLAAEGAGLQTGAYVALARFPSLGSLHSATEDLTKKTAGRKVTYIVHPNPALPDGLRDVANDMADARLNGCRTLSLDEFRVALR